ncbi:MAG: response regulator [Desulfuromonadaceae bacterium]|nr:response regulator [Desulfuromonadaceae bacterium]
MLTSYSPKTSSEVDYLEIRRIRHIAWDYTVAWTLLISASAAFNIKGFLITDFQIPTYIYLTIHIFIWIVGICVNMLGANKLINSIERQKLVDSELQEKTRRLEEEISEREKAHLFLERSEEKLQEQYYELQATEEMLREQLGQYELSQTHLKESNSNLRTVFDVTPLPIIISSCNDGAIVEMNNAFSNSFGYSQKISEGKTCQDFGIWDDINELNCFIRIINEQNGVFGFVGKLKNSSGDIRKVQLYSNIIDYKSNKCLLIVFIDMTDQLRLEENLRQSQKLEVVGQLAGGIAHDFNNMLTAILGSAEMLGRYIKNDSAEMKLLNTINDAAGRSADLTAQLLAFSRKGSSVIVRIWIHKTIRSAISLLEHSISKDITIETRFAADRDLVVGDSAQLQNALLNLGINAKDSMPDGGVITYTTANVYMDAEYCRLNDSNLQPGNYIEISVSDSGTGMDKEVIEHIFEPFYTTKGIGKGTGLGLAAVYGTVKEHSGSVSVFSEPAIGTVFKLYIPVVEEQNKPEQITPDKNRLSPGTILLVDDEQLIREMCKALLEERGYMVYLAENGAEAIEVYNRYHDDINLVIMDLIMPVMGGKEALRHLSSAYPDIKVLLSSGFQQDDSSDTLVKIGAAGFIPKPYRTEELFKAVDSILLPAKN